MIVRPRPTLPQLFFILRGSIVSRIAPHIIVFTLYAAVIVAAAKYFDIQLRNNAAYDRWWEARKLWGQLVFDIRNFSRAAIALVPADSGEVRPLLMQSL